MRAGEVHDQSEADADTVVLNCLMDLSPREWPATVGQLRSRRMVLLAWCACSRCLRALHILTRSQI